MKQEQKKNRIKRLKCLPKKHNPAKKKKWKKLTESNKKRQKLLPNKLKQLTKDSLKNLFNKLGQPKHNKNQWKNGLKWRSKPQLKKLNSMLRRKKIKWNQNLNNKLKRFWLSQMLEKQLKKKNLKKSNKNSKPNNNLKMTNKNKKKLNLIWL